jgi:hypothetical protein
MTQNNPFWFTGLFLCLPFIILSQISLEHTYPTTNLHRVDWTYGGEKYWYADDSLKEIKIFSAQHNHVKTIRYPSVSNAQIQLLKGDYGVSQTTINPDNLLEMVWLIKDTALKQDKLQIRNERDSVLFIYELPFESINFSEIDGLPTKMFITTNESNLSEYTTKVYSIPNFQWEMVYFRAYSLNRKKFGYAGEKYFYKDIVGKRMQIYNPNHTLWKSIYLGFQEKIVLNRNETYTHVDDNIFVQDSLVEVSFSYSISDDFGQAIIN